MTNPRIVVIGAGPTGLGAACRLHELGFENWILYEKSDHVGGHAASHVDQNGFLWDEGGHVIFSHYSYFDRLIDETLGSEVHECVRESWIVCGGSPFGPSSSGPSSSRSFSSGSSSSGTCWVPYPFQNNLRYLPKEVQLRCLLGAARASAIGNAERSDNFREWILATFGEGIAEAFMFPYNSKVWTTPLERMSKSWIAERVSVVDFKRLLENVICQRDDVGWGPNSKFKFPLHGGTGEIYRRLAARFPDKVRRGKAVAEVDTTHHTVSFADGTGDRYDVLISTLPLDLLVRMLTPAAAKLTDATQFLEHNSLLVIGLGLEKPIETSKCWVYFTNADMPAYRGTYFSHYSPFNVPNGDTSRYSSLMCEVSVASGGSVDAQATLEGVTEGLIRAEILEPDDRQHIVSRYHRFVDYSYPIPTLERDQALAALQPALLEQKIYSRGRFGTWRYEIGNMDHSVMMGVEAVNRALRGEKESVFEDV
jgi:protoporphyrinogen oxidase